MNMYGFDVSEPAVWTKANGKKEAVTIIAATSDTRRLIIRDKFGRVKAVFKKRLDTKRCINCNGFCPSGLLPNAVCLDCKDANLS